LANAIEIMLQANVMDACSMKLYSSSSENVLKMINAKSSGIKTTERWPAVTLPLHLTFQIRLSPPFMPPFPFGRVCFVVLVMRKGGESS